MNSLNSILGVLAVLATATIPHGLFAQAGSLDPSFGADGVVTTAIGEYNDAAYAIVVQPDGKIVVAGVKRNIQTGDFTVVRYNADGTLDNSFGTGGKVITAVGVSDAEAYSMALQPDGKIVVAGYASNGADTDFAVVRYNADGSLDSGFGTNGQVVTDVGAGLDSGFGVALQPDGKIVVAGYAYNGPFADFAVVRYGADGTLDSGFSGDGKVTTAVGALDANAYAVAIQADGRIVAAGSSYNGTDNDFALVRYNADGTLDAGFSGDGIVTTTIGANYDDALSVAIQPDGKIIAAGATTNFTDADMALIRYNVDGTLDNGFGTDGIATTTFGTNNDGARAVTIQPDGKIVATGYTINDTIGDIALVRYATDGTLDNSFGMDGRVTTAIGTGIDDAYAVALQPDGKIVAAGYSFNDQYTDLALVRYLSGLNIGLLEFSAPAANVLVYPNPIDNGSTLRYTLEKQETISIELVDMEGKATHTLMADQIQGAGEHQQVIVLPHWATGAYLIVISSANGRVSIRVAK